MKPEYVIHLLSRTRDRIQKHLSEEFLKQGIQDLVPAHGGVLFILGKEGPLIMSELAKLLDRTNSTVTALLDKMEEFGYVKRSKPYEDERVTSAELTDKGKQTLEKVQRASKATLTKLSQNLEQGEKEEFMRILTKIHSNFDI
ncbi:MarR family winged helix-turn-helix transcriptional regulator [Leptospira haakeii]|uniref:MarR family transcriptional regulator n=1 Tax=Leptospira haakeii TaxID=2023198 RepID=A0ABX4PRB7_9LEPT|nr:MarR family transcriptional regulator [Leptospira haakeii]PKA17573.1 MarR family transcriptional regulator [Leptospira haakeii]PKA21298.1 MarR family transcriptional regulator [Leptospira haakeii]